MRYPLIASAEAGNELRPRNRSFKGRVASGLALCLVGGLLLGCSGSSKRTPALSPRVVEYGQPVPKGGGRYKVGAPYRIGDRWYVPREDPSYDRVGIASWYGDLFHGRYTANGEIYDMDALTAAHPTLPMPVYVRVTNLENGRSLVVRVNDRGPYKPGRIIDLSRRSAELLGFKRQGTARVRVTYLGRAPLNGDDSFERRVLASQRWYRGGLVRHARGPVYGRNHRGPSTTASLPPTEVRSVATRGRLQPLVRRQRHSVLAGSFRYPDNAERLRARLSSLGPVRVALVQKGNVLWHKVFLGPFTDRKQAERAWQGVLAAGVPDALIVTE